MLISGLLQQEAVNTSSCIYVYAKNGTERGKSNFYFLHIANGNYNSLFLFKKQFVNWNTGILCAIGGIIGGFTGAKLLNKIPDKYLKLAFAIFLIYAGWNMLF